MGQGALTKERIFEAALKAFALHGYEGARMDKIAAEVNINKATLYFHFKSKEDIFRELFQNIVQKYRDKMKAIVTGCKDMPCKECLKTIYREYLEYNLNNAEMDFWNRIYYLPPVDLREEIISITSESKKEFVANLTCIMEEGIKQKELRSMNPSHMAYTFYNILTCIDLSSGLMSKEQALQEMDCCFEVLWNGIKGM
ncbi:MAG: TetR/AcrR family transcriptional regulator [Tissierellia bacterium]|jgi:AcrR family transcriptional regulator|nr:TetR/AcrR family transcriptional regulator [Tissierellia bacterium]